MADILLDALALLKRYSETYLKNNAQEKLNIQAVLDRANPPEPQDKPKKKKGK